MKATELIPVPTSKVTLGSIEVASLPSGGHGYVLTNQDGEILFIGGTNRLNNTIRLHSKNFAKLKGIEDEIDCHYIASSEEFLKIEKNWMEQHFQFAGKFPSCNIIVDF